MILQNNHSNCKNDILSFKKHVGNIDTVAVKLCGENGQSSCDMNNDILHKNYQEDHLFKVTLELNHSNCKNYIW